MPTICAANRKQERIEWKNNSKCKLSSSETAFETTKQKESTSSQL